MSEIASFVKSSEIKSFPYEHRRLAACHAGLVVQKMTISIFVYGQQYVSSTSIANIFEKLFHVFFPYD